MPLVLLFVSQTKSKWKSSEVGGAKKEAKRERERERDVSMRGIAGSEADGGSAFGQAGEAVSSAVFFWLRGGGARAVGV